MTLLTVPCIEYALIEVNMAGHEIIVANESRQLNVSEKNFSDNHIELLAMKYDLVKFRLHLIISKLYKIYIKHTSQCIVI